MKRHDWRISPFGIRPTPVTTEPKRPGSLAVTRVSRAGRDPAAWLRGAVLICCAAFLVLAGSARAAGEQKATPENPITYGYEGEEVWPDLNAAWPEAEAKGLKYGTNRPAATQTAAAPAAAPAAEPAAVGAATTAMIPPPAEKVRVRNHEVSASADFMFGQGDVTLPLGFSLNTSLQGTGVQVTPGVVKPSRDSTYYGATLSYGYKQAIYLDVAYSTGESSGSTDAVLGSGQALPADFQINDDWYQLYFRYTFPQLRFKPVSAYVRAGVSLVQSDLDFNTDFPALGLYQQTDKTEDLLGNVGFGVLWSFYTTRHFRAGLQGEGEGFYGQRSQESLEVLPASGVPNSFWKTADINNDLYGVIGRGTLRLEYRPGRSGAFRIYFDGGMQVRYTFITYPDLGTFEELLWGPYAKVGARFTF